MLFDLCIYHDGASKIFVWFTQIKELNFGIKYSDTWHILNTNTVAVLKICYQQIFLFHFKGIATRSIPAVRIECWHFLFAFLQTIDVSQVVIGTQRGIWGSCILIMKGMVMAFHGFTPTELPGCLVVALYKPTRPQFESHDWTFRRLGTFPGMAPRRGISLRKPADVSSYFCGDKTGYFSWKLDHLHLWSWRPKQVL